MRRLVVGAIAECAMPISGLVITLENDAQHRDAAMQLMRGHASITLGSEAGHRVPIVVETANSDEDGEVWAWLQQLPGVVGVELAYAQFAVKDCNAEQGQLQGLETSHERA